MEPHRAPGRLFFFLLGLLALFPALVGLQWMLRFLGARQSYLVADLVVHLNEKNATHLVLALYPDPARSSFPGGVLMEGAGMHKASSFPWPEEPFEARLAMDLSLDALSPLPATLSTEDGTMVAWYRERYLGAKGGLSMRVPCHGAVTLQRVQPEMGGASWDWARLRRFDADLQLACTSFGRDLEWGTDDDLEWTLSGLVELRWQKPQ